MTPKQKREMEDLFSSFGLKSMSIWHQEANFQRFCRLIIQDSLAKLSPSEAQQYRNFLFDDPSEAAVYADSLGLITPMEIPGAIKHRLNSINFDYFLDVYTRSFDTSSKVLLVEPNDKMFNRIAILALNCDLFVIEDKQEGA